MSSTDATPAGDREPDDAVQLLRGGRLYQRLVVDPMCEAPDRLPVKRTGLLLAVAWLPLAILAALDGEFLPSGVERLAFLEDVTVHVRLLLGLATLVLIEPFVRERLALVVNYLGRSDLIREAERPRWDAAIGRAQRRRDSLLAELVLLALAVAMSVWGTFSAGNDLHTDLRLGAWRWSAAGTPSPAGWWYTAVAGPILLYHILRWLYRLGIWTDLLRSLSRLRLQFRPAHPDLAGGLGILSVSQTVFCLFFAALSVMSAGSLAHEIFHAGHSILEYRYLIGLFACASLLILYGPLLLFARAAILAREIAFSEYAATANLMFTEYESQWIAGVWKRDPGGMIDPSAMTDYSQVFENIRRMRPIALDPASVATAAGIVLLPYVPLIFTALSLAEVIQRLAQAVL